MCPVSLTVWFLCKSCTLNFAKVDDYIEHKKENHFTEFQAQNTSCIVFEERIDIDGDLDNESGSVKATPKMLNEEFQLPNDSRMETSCDVNIASSFTDSKLTCQIADDDLNATQTNSYDWNSESNRDVLGTQNTGVLQAWQTDEYIPTETDEFNWDSESPAEAILDPKIELVTYGSEIEEAEVSLVGSVQHNPYVLLKRMTSKEIQDASSGYNQKSNLNKNLKSLCIPRTFKCNQLGCGKAFKYKWSLNTHMTCHSDLRPFGCPHCDKKFKRRGHVAEHVRVHTGERPYKCPVDNCGKTFAQFKALWSHKKSCIVSSNK